jgi:hypothetical protein
MCWSTRSLFPAEENAFLFATLFISAIGMCVGGRGGSFLRIKAIGMWSWTLFSSQWKV